MKKIFKFLLILVYALWTIGYFLMIYESSHKFNYEDFLVWSFSLLIFMVFTYFFNLCFKLIDYLK